MLDPLSRMVIWVQLPGTAATLGQTTHMLPELRQHLPGPRTQLMFATLVYTIFLQ